MASGYGSAIEPAVAGLPLQVAGAAGDSIGAASTIAGQLGAQGQALLQAARAAYIEGMGEAVLVGSAGSTLGAVLVLLFLPARPRLRDEAPGEFQPAQPEPAETRG
jgi:hypothetical protein